MALKVHILLAYMKNTTKICDYFIGIFSGVFFSLSKKIVYEASIELPDVLPHQQKRTSFCSGIFEFISGCLKLC